MYAIIQTGGKQYRISPGDVLRVERLPGERGDEVILDQVLLVTDGVAIQVGQPLVPNATRAHPDRAPGQRQEGPDLQKETPEKLSPQARPPAAVHRLANR